MAKMNYEEMSEDIIRLVGGSENIHKASHCFTRLRLDLADLSKADTEATYTTKPIIFVYQLIQARQVAMKIPI